MIKTIERAVDPFMWLVCWAAFRLLIAIPSPPRSGQVDRLWRALLPYAGFYAYHGPGLPWRWSERNRAYGEVET
jgi:hypothetical protein